MDDLVPTWLDQLLATDPQQQEGALRKLIYHSTRETTIQRIKKSGKIKYITAALKSENEYVSMLAAWVTALVTFKDEETRHLFARANVIEGLVQLLENTDNPNVVQKACWAITNLSSDDEIREMMAQTPMMKLLTHLYRSTSSIDVKKAAIEPLINLLADKEQQRLFSRGGGISATISLFPYLEDEGEQKNATIMLYFMSIHFDELRAEIVRQGTLPVLQKQLLLKDNSIRELTMRLLNNLSVCEMNEMPILGSGVLFPVFDLLNSDDASEDLKKQSLMLLSNLATNEQVRASIRYCAWLEPVMNLLSNSRMDINEQALRFVINITFDEYCRKQLLDTGAVDLINGKKPQWSSGTEQINKLSLMAIENLLTPISDAVQAYLKTEVEIEFTPIEDDDDEVIDVQSDEDGKATIDPTSPRDKNLVIGAKHDEAKKPVHEEPSMDLDLVLEQLKVLSEHRKRVKENKEQAHKVQIQQQQQVTARREEEEKIKQKMTRENKLRTEGTLHARREVVAKDLLKTESDFLKTLEDVLKHYVLPLREAISTQRPVISEADVRSIFSITDMLYNINKSFLEKIKNRLKNWSYESIIGDIFTDLAAYFKAYQQYINNYSDAVATYSKCAKNNKEFQKFVKQAELKTDETDLFELLIQPINRVPKYLEYLHEFEKFTPSHHPDVRPVKKAIDSFELLVNFVNEIKPVAEKANKIIELENKFSNLEETLLTPTRLLIKDGTFIQEKKSGSRYIYLFLFNDVLVISMQRNKKQHKIRQIIHLTKIDNAMELSAPTLVANDELSYEVSTLNSSERPTIEDSTGLFRFAIIFEENGKKRAIAVAAPTVADRSAWVTAINTECRALKSKAAHDDHALGSTPKFNADNSDM